MKNEWDEYADIWDSVALEYSEKAYFRFFAKDVCYSQSKRDYRLNCSHKYSNSQSHYQSSCFTETLELLSSLLKPQGLFIQWDWLKESSKSESGLSKEEVQEALTHSGLANISVSVPFEMNHPEGTMPVLMATGVKQNY